MSALTSYRNQIQAENVAVILVSLQELFLEHVETVTPSSWQKLMENKNA